MHLDETQLADLALGRGSSDDHIHLDGCATCRKHLESWRMIMNGLHHLSRENITDSELHKLRTMFRTHVQGGSTLRRWIAELNAPVCRPSTHGVRGSGAGIRHYSAGPFSVIVQVTNDGRQGWIVHGQIVSEQPTAMAPAELAISNDQGRGVTTTVDSHGEFRCTGMAPGQYTATWWLDNDRIDLHEFTIGDEGG